MNSIFPADRLGRADYILGLAFLSGCFVFFFHGDIFGAGWDSLNYLFGSPLEFYENCKKIRGGGQNMVGTPYPPSIYAIFALWLYPFKLIGVLESPEVFPFYLTYWLKGLTTIVYFASGLLFYQISLKYSTGKDFAKYATTAWLTMPLAIFSQFIFSQYDIFYVFLTLAGFLMFIRSRLVLASVLFGLAITFKYFPAFVFVPLLLLYEKRFSRLFFYCAIFIAPTIVIDVLYGQSAAFIEGVKNHGSINRVFASSLDVGGWQIYFLFASFTILCGIAYFADFKDEVRLRIASYIWLVSSILPFIFIIWHPQWVIFFAPAIVLTSMLSRSPEKFMLLDIAGMLCFVAVISIAFKNNVDAAMFKGALIGLDFGNSYPMAKLFERFSDHSLNVFLSGFWAYLILQIVLKYKQSFQFFNGIHSMEIDYSLIRRAFYVGLLIFLLPATLSVYKDLRRGETLLNNEVPGKIFGELLNGRIFEQTFVSKGVGIKSVSLLLSTFARQNNGDVILELIDQNGTTLFKTNKAISDIKNNAWSDFSITPIVIMENQTYKLRLTSSTGVPGNSITWLASPGNIYKKGESIIDGSEKNYDFCFKIVFVK